MEVLKAWLFELSLLTTSSMSTKARMMRPVNAVEIDLEGRLSGTLNICCRRCRGDRFNTESS